MAARIDMGLRTADDSNEPFTICCAAQSAELLTGAWLNALAADSLASE
jgi:hypothetical protein